VWVSGVAVFKLLIVAWLQPSKYRLKAGGINQYGNTALHKPARAHIKSQQPTALLPVVVGGCWFVCSNGTSNLHFKSVQVTLLMRNCATSCAAAQTGSCAGLLLRPYIYHALRR